MNINILHLYYDIMNLYGEYGNIKVLERHLIDQGVNVIVDKKSIGDEIDFNKYDFIYIGSGTENNQLFVLKDLLKRKDNLKEYIENDGFALFTGNSYEMLGKAIDDKEALSIFDFETKTEETRTTSDIICTSDIIEDKIIGFINSMSIVSNNDKPLFKVLKGGAGNEEGIRHKNTFGTHIIGPILVRNPELLKYFIKELCISKDNDYIYKELIYDEEEMSYKIALKELENRDNLNTRE